MHLWRKRWEGERCCHCYDSCSLHVCPFFSLFRCQLINSFHSWSSDSRAGCLTHLMPGHSATQCRLLSSLWNGHLSTPNNGHSSVKDNLVPPQHSWAPHLKSLVIMKEDSWATLSVLLRLEITPWNQSTCALQDSSTSGSLGVRMEKVSWSTGLGWGLVMRV